MLENTKDRWFAVRHLTFKDQYSYTLTEKYVKVRLKQLMPHIFNQQGIRTVWFNVSLAQSEWISVLSNEFGFVIHHANPPSVIVMLKWISETETYQVPQE